MQIIRAQELVIQLICSIKYWVDPCTLFPLRLQYQQ